MSDYLVRASALEGYDRLVSELGGNPADLRAVAGISPAPLAGDAWIPYRNFCNLLEESARALRCPHFGLSLSRYQDIGILGTVGFVMREAPDVKTALLELSKYFTLHNQGGEVNLSVDAGVACLSFDPKLSASVRMEQQFDDLGEREV